MQSLQIYLINPRGFCAGVTRAIEVVEKALQKFGAPLYIRNEIVHNKIVVDYFKNKGVIFVKDINEIPKGANTVFSAHGTALSVEEQAKENNLNYIDATCPLVTNVHKLGMQFYQNGYQIVLVGHKGHPEIEGTMGRIPANITLVCTVQDAQNITLDNTKPIAYITQTTLSLDDTADIVNVLKQRFPNIQGLATKNICYATQNRQNAIKEIINQVDALIVLGSKNSSNSNRLKEIGTKNNKLAFLIDTANEIPYNQLTKVKSVAISAGASAPESAVQQVIASLQKHYNATLHSFDYKQENVQFALPKSLRN